MCKQESKLNRRHQGGVIVILLGLAIVMLIGFAGLAIDLGRFFLIKTELQNAVDACALSAASQLRPGQNNNQALIKAVAYGRVFSTGGTSSFTDIKNRGNFQSTVLDITDITFSNTINGSYQASGSVANDYNTAKYVKCSYPLADIPVLFMKVLDPSQFTATVSATAIATQGPSASVCAIPIGICKATGSSNANDYGLTLGNWYTVKSGASSQGWFGWIDFTPPGGGASEAADLFTGNGQCDLVQGSDVAQQGNIASLAVAWNSRFGWYKNGVGNPQPSTAAPDFSGYAYSAGTASKPGNWLAGSNAWSGSSPLNPTVPNFQTQRSNHVIFQTDMPPGIPNSGGYSPLTQAQHITYGKNRRLAVAPVLDCSNPAKVKIEDWACVFMLNPYRDDGSVKAGEIWDQANVEFLGLSTKIGSVCSTGGGPGTAGPVVPVMAQ